MFPVLVYPPPPKSPPLLPTERLHSTTKNYWHTMLSLGSFFKTLANFDLFGTQDCVIMSLRVFALRQIRGIEESTIAHATRPVRAWYKARISVGTDGG